MQAGSGKLARARHVLAGTERTWCEAGREVGPDRRWTASFSLAAIDKHLSMGGINAPSLHEVHGGVGNGAASGFVLWLARLALVQMPGPVFWIKAPTGGDHDALYPPALEDGVRDKMIMIEARQRRDVLWAFEEILNSGQAACVIAETDHMDLTAARRLQLASENGHSLAIALCQSSPDTKAGNSVARTRWRVATRQDGWSLELLGGRGVRPGEWKVKRDATTLSLHLVSASGDRPVSDHHPVAA